MKSVPTPMVTRVFVSRTGNRQSKKSFIFTDCVGPPPRVGDAITIRNVDYTIVKMKREPVIAEFQTEGSKLKQVFPPTSTPAPAFVKGKRTTN